MTVLLWTVAAAGALPYLAVLVQNAAKLRQERTYDNAAPRAQSARLVGYGQRAAWAQANTWEALTLFFAAALVAHVTGADGDRAGQLGIGFIASRVLYLPAYLANYAALRSALWTCGFACTVGLLALAAAR